MTTWLECQEELHQFEAYLQWIGVSEVSEQTKRVDNQQNVGEWKPENDGEEKSTVAYSLALQCNQPYKTAKRPTYLFMRA
jgi:hypothetical protein